MTPKKKARELVDKYHYQICNDNGISESESTTISAKNCALICCDEMINESDEYEFGHPNLVEERKQFWQSVKTEIETL